MVRVRIQRGNWCETVSVSSAKGPRKAGARRWVFVAPDQLHRGLGALADRSPADTGVVLLESREWLSRRPYHRMRVAMILLNQRAFAEELKAEGFEVRVERGDAPMVQLLRQVAQACGPMLATEWAEREMRHEFRAVVDEGLLQVQPHDGWLTAPEDFAGCRRGTQWSMDAFYRRVRHRTGLLMDETGEPQGGRWSFDTENRKAWPGTPAAPAAPRFAMDALRRGVQATMERDFSEHPGELDLEALPATVKDGERLWTWAKAECLPHFGPFEDAMSIASRGLFHSRMSPLMNLWRMPARRMVQDVAAMALPIESKEGFIRQVIGWREFVRWVHLQTDGFRDAWPAAAGPGDGGFSRWKGAPWAPVAAAPQGVDGGARPAALGGSTPLPPAFWGRASGLHCLDRVVQDVWSEGWSHHITRLMVLGNLATLLDVDARELADWFWIAYMDAWDWVVEPNVLAMATYATGGGRRDDHQALRGGQRLHRWHERLLRRLRVQAGEGLPDHAALLGLPAASRGQAACQPQDEAGHGLAAATRRFAKVHRCGHLRACA
ncbi:MAG: deoxyribodipyrimidine photolyase [Planctomycetes bacterium]|nr:deoxyribodipyrimidine photolyase [Planctomycetota bacterium]